MLSVLHVENYVLIDSLDIHFPEGLIIITGQTGAGKSILLGALSLVLGARSDSSVIGDHGENCVVEAEFDVEEDDTLRNVFNGNDLEWDGGHIIIRRTLSRSGRSRTFVNDSPVPLAVLQELSSRLVDIHSQHDTRLLSDRRYQMGILDYYAGNTELLRDCRASWEKLSSLRKSLSEAKDDLEKSKAEKDYTESRFNELDAAHLVEGELESLEEEEKKLSNAEDIKMGLGTIAEGFSPSEEGRPSIDSLIKESVKTLNRLSRFIPSLETLSSRLESSRLEIDDIIDEIVRTDSEIELSESRLQMVSERISFLYSLMKKHSCSTVGELIELRDSLSDKLFDSASLEERIASLEKSLSAARKEYDSLAGALDSSRRKAAGGFAEAVGDSLEFLELEKAVFLVEVGDAPEGPSGRNSVTFMFSSTGKAPLELSKCASGGEMSRIMLGLKAMLARYTDMPSLVFDEIDSGVSGSAADKMGSMICRMGENMQVFAITHLPQVAAKGNAHYLVSKSGDVSSISRIDGEERVMEIARMLSGSSISEAAIQNAKTLLG